MPRGESGYFTRDTIQFLKDLSRHNNREWFQANKSRYESAVQDPAVRFIEAMGPHLARISPHLVADARPFGGSLSRIYRDTRFAKDKSPYKTHVGIHFSHDQAGKAESSPGFFFHVAPGESAVYSGMWHPEPPALKGIRDSIAGSPSKWAKVLAGGLEISGESYARVPTGYDPESRYAADLKRKDFFADRSISDTQLVAPSFGSRFVAMATELAPLNEFLAGAIGMPW